jgi:hypothetical protein
MSQPLSQPTPEMTALATSAVVVSASDIRLAMVVGDEPAITLVLGPADALALACDLLSAARQRFGRPAAGAT